MLVVLTVLTFGVLIVLIEAMRRIYNVFRRALLPRIDRSIGRGKGKLVLLLRSFADDDISVPRTNISWERMFASGYARWIALGPFLDWIEWRSFEKTIVRALRSVGTVVALGEVDDYSSPVAAVRLAVSDHEWRRTVCEFMDRADLVVLVLSATASVLEEMQFVYERRHLDKLLVVVPPMTNRERVFMWDCFRARMQDVGLVCPDVLPHSALVLMPRLMVLENLAEGDKTAVGYRAAIGYALGKWREQTEFGARGTSVGLNDSNVR